MFAWTVQPDLKEMVSHVQMLTRYGKDNALHHMPLSVTEEHIYGINCSGWSFSHSIVLFLVCCLRSVLPESMFEYRTWLSMQGLSKRLQR